jgi:hypothetical protein
MKALEDDSDFRLKTLKENDMDNKDIEEIKTRLKVTNIIDNITVFRIRSRVDFGLLDPDPGWQKLPTEIEKSEEISCFNFLDVLFCSPVAWTFFMEA